MSQVVSPPSATPHANREHPVKDIPVWLTAVILVLCIGGGSFLVWKYATTNAPEPITIAAGHPRTPLVKNWRPSDDAASARAPKKTQDDDVDGIKALTPNRSWRVRAGNAYMFVNLNPRKNELEISPNYRSIYTPEQNQLVIMRQRLLQDDAMRDFLKVTPDQLQKLRSVPPPEGMKMPPEEKKKLTDLFEAFRAAKDSQSQAGAEKAVVAALDEIGKKRFEETKAYMLKRVEAIQSALTPDQINLFNKGPTNSPNAAARG